MTPTQRTAALRLAKALQNCGNEEEEAADLLRELASEPVQEHQVAAGMPATCQTQEGCRDHGCHGACLPVQEPESVTIQEVWEAAGGNPGIKPAKSDLLSTLRMLDAAVDEAAEIRRTFSETVQEPIDCGEAGHAEKRCGNASCYAKPVAWMGLHDRTDLFYRKPSQVEVIPLYAAPQQRKPLTPRELKLIDGMIEVQLYHADQCDRIANRVIADRQKGWDMERVELLRKLREHGIKETP